MDLLRLGKEQRENLGATRPGNEPTRLAENLGRELATADSYAPTDSSSFHLTGQFSMPSYKAGPASPLPYSASSLPNQSSFGEFHWTHSPSRSTGKASPGQTPAEGRARGVALQRPPSLLSPGFAHRPRASSPTAFAEARQGFAQAGVPRQEMPAAMLARPATPFVAAPFKQTFRPLPASLKGGDVSLVHHSSSKSKASPPLRLQVDRSRLSRL